MAPAKNVRSSTRRSTMSASRGPPAAQAPDNDNPQHACPPEVLRSQPPQKHQRYLDTTLPPMHDLTEIFADLLKKAKELGFDELLRKLSKRPLVVATVCSGTESPVLALETIQKVDRSDSFNFTHTFSCEIVAFKQAYIERNFGPPLLFRDCSELGDEFATTAYGASESVPGGLDMMIAGTACVDFSMLNSNKDAQQENGESMNTFQGLVRYVDRKRPRILVLENVRAAPWPKFAAALRDVGFITTVVNVDTKDYYIPQTRQRSYMVAFDLTVAGMANVSTADMLAHTQQLVTEFKRPASSPAGMFCLGEEDARREQIDRDLSTRLEASVSRAEVDWTRYQQRHKDYRLSSKAGNDRPISRSLDGGVTCHPPEFYLHPWFEAQVERIWDTVDIKQLIAIGKGKYDINYKERWIDLSQGVDRGGDSTDSMGVIGCLTPSGMPFASTQGAILSGMEALSLQGLPLDRMMLTRESQRECQDLAGNAMTTTVVASTMLAALIAGAKLLEPGALHNADVSAGPDKQLTLQLDPSDNLSVTDFELLRKKSAIRQHPELAEEVEIRLRGWKSARYCWCQKQSGVTATLLECGLCGHTICSSCAGNPTHDYKPANRIQSDPIEYRAFLKGTLPKRVSLSGLRGSDFQAFQEQLHPSEWSKYLDAINPALSDGTGIELRFKEIKRLRVWTIIYDGQNGSMHLEVHKDGFQWLYFAKIPTHMPAQCLTREILAKPIARMYADGDKLMEGTWQICTPISLHYRLKINGIGEPTKSFAAALGITYDNVDKQTVYPTIQVDAKDSDMSPLDVDIRGEYSFLPECGTALGSLYIQQCEENKKPVFVFFDPRKVGNIDHDAFVFATDHGRLSGYDIRSTIAELACTWKPTHVQSEPEFVDAFSRHWHTVSSGNLQEMGKPDMVPISLPSTIEIRANDVGCRAAYVPLAGIRGEENLMGMPACGTSWKQMDPAKTTEMLKSLVWAIQEFSTWADFEEWKPLKYSTIKDSSSKDEPVCSTCEPPTPKIKWGRSDQNQIVHYEDPLAAANFERAVKSKPPPFTAFNRSEGEGRVSFVVGLNVQSLAHQAYSKLANTAKPGVNLEWRLVPNDQDFGRRPWPTIHIPGNGTDLESQNPPNFKYALRKEQLRSLSWMKSQEEEGTQPFMKQVVEEACFPLLSWRAEVKAEMPETIRGGVLADEVGYGKTAIVLGLIDCGFDQTSKFERPEAPKPEDSGLIPVKGTLILVPDNVFVQWSSEIRKFLGNKYKVLEIRKMVTFAKISVREMEDADIILASWNVIQGQSYYQTLQQLTAAPDVPKACGRIFDSWFENAAKHTTELVQTLTSKGTEEFLTEVAERRKRLFEKKTIDYYVPSFRLRGAKFQASQNAKKQQKQQNDDSLGQAEKQDPDIVEESNAEESSVPRKKQKLTRTSTEYQDDGEIVMSGASFDPSFDEISDAMDIEDPESVLYRETEGRERSPKTDNKATDLSVGPVDNPVSGTKSAPDTDPDYQSESDPESVADTDPDYQSESDAIGKKRKRGTAKPPAKKAPARRAPARRAPARRAPAKKAPAKKAPAKKARVPKDPPPEKTPAQREAENRKKFNLPKASSQSAPMDWRSMKNLPLHAYRFERFVIDEYTYIGEDRRMPLALMQARSKWILSGTPAVEEFSDIKSIAQYLGLDLGEDDDGDAPTRNSRLKIHRRTMTALEKFLLYKPRHTDAWYQERHRVAVRFVNQFMRHNKAEIKDIPLVKHYVVTSQSAKEKESYEVLYAHLLSKRGRTLKIRATNETTSQEKIDQIFRLNQFLEKTRVPEESLLKCSTTPSLDKHVGVAESSKIASVVRMVSRIPEDEYVLLFVQFEDLMHVMAHAFETAGITAGMATSKNTSILKKYGELDPTKDNNRARRTSRATTIQDPEDDLEEPEQGSEWESDTGPKATKGKGPGKKAASSRPKPTKDGSMPKVLILHLGSAMAAGLNLQMINHIIFLSPLLAPTQHEYEAGMTQAIGRCQRYGQQRTVHVYHVLVKHSADVNILQDREGGIVVVRGGQARFVRPEDRDEVREEDELCVGPELRWEAG